MKNYTDIEQSKKLVEILPIESADMTYIGSELIPYPYCESKFKGEDNVYPAWSLAALLELLKEKIIFGGNSPKGWFCCYTIKNPTKVLTIYGDSLVDACVAMIEKLHELNLL